MIGNSDSRPGRIFEISAVSNPRIKSVRALSQKKHRDQTGTFLAEGLKLVRDALEGGWKLETVIHANPVEQQPNFESFVAKARVLGADIIQVNQKVLSSITRKDNPQTVLGVIRQNWAKAPTNVTDKSSVWIALDRVRDPGNLGTIIRTADSAGADGVILVGETTDPFSLEATRATMGSIFNVPVVRQTLDEFLVWREDWNGLSVGTHLKGAVDFRAIDYSRRPVLLVMGNEQKGLPDNIATACDHLAYIPMHGRADSLNLAVATGVMLFQMGKRLPAFGKNGGEEK